MLRRRHLGRSRHGPRGPPDCQYAFDSWGVSATAKFTATAFCDIDCAGVFATFQLVGGSAASSGGPACHAFLPPRLFADFENEQPCAHGSSRVDLRGTEVRTRPKRSSVRTLAWA